ASTPLIASASNGFPSSSNSPMLSESASGTSDTPCKSPDCRPLSCLLFLTDFFFIGAPCIQFSTTLGFPRGSLPAASKGFIQLDNSQGFLESLLAECQFGLKEIPIGIECIELGIHSATIAHIGKTQSILQSLDESFLLFPALADFLVSG